MKKPGFKQYVADLKLLFADLNESAGRIYVLNGANGYLISKAVDALRGRWQGRSLSIEANDIQSADQFLELFRQSSLFDPQRLVFIRRCEQVRGFGKLLTKYMPSGTPAAKVVFMWQGALDKAAKDIFQQDPQRTRYLDCPEMQPWEMEGFVISFGKKYGVTFEQNAVRTFLEVVGNNLWNIENELQKLGLIFANDSKSLGPRDIIEHTQGLREDHAFELSRLLLDEQVANAHLLLQELIDRGEAPMALIGILAHHYRNGLQLSDPKAANGARLPRSIVAKYHGWLRDQSRAGCNAQKQLTGHLQRCLWADMTLKSSGSIAEDLILSRVVAPAS